MQHSSSRQLGSKIFRPERTDVESLIEQIPVWKEALKEHGVVVVKGVNLESPDLTELGKRFGEDVFMPMPFFTNKDERFPEIVRIGNVLMDGSLKEAQSEFSTWH